MTRATTAREEVEELQAQLQKARDESRSLRVRLMEAEDTLRAIRQGEVDALIVSTPQGEQVFTLKGADQSYRTFVETMCEGGLILTLEGTILYSNQSFAEIVGTASEKIIGASIFDYVTDEQAEPMAALIQIGLKGGGKQELTLRAVNGTSVPAFLSLRPIVDSDLTDTLCLVATDLREQKSAQERTAQVEELLGKLEAANKELETFSYSISHDLREPLRAIEGFSRMLLKDLQDRLDSDSRRKFEVIREKTKKMDQLIQDVLTFSRLSAQTMAVTLIDWEKIATEAWEDIRTNHEGRDINLTLSPLANCPADKNMIRQVFVNLFSNALKFTQGRDQALVEVGSEEKPNECVYFVKDNGVGFDMNFADKLFRLFQRLHGADEYAGTGVGLSFVKRIINRHGGRVWAEGRVNEGATFYFSLPKDTQSPI